MKLVRYGAPGREKPGIIGDDGKIRDLSRIVKDIDGAMLASGGLAKIKKANLKRMKPVSGKPRLGPCIGNVRNFIAIGLNYSDHAAEAGMPIPKEPIIFNKAPTWICGPNDDTIIPRNPASSTTRSNSASSSASARAISRKDKAMDAVAGYFLVERRVGARLPDRALGRPVEQGQGLRDLRPDRPVVRHQGRDQGPAESRHVARRQRREAPARQHQDDDLRGCEHLVWYCSQFFVMEPGDIIITGTPPGVALGMKPTPIFLKAGDVVTLGIAKLGEQRQKVVAAK